MPETFLESRTTLLKDVGEYESMYKQSVEDPEAFWAEIANTFHWETVRRRAAREKLTRSRARRASPSPLSSSLCPCQPAGGAVRALGAPRVP